MRGRKQAGFLGNLIPPTPGEQHSVDKSVERSLTLISAGSQRQLKGQ